MKSCLVGYESEEKQRVVSDRSRTDRVNERFDVFVIGGLWVSRVCELPFARGALSFKLQTKAQDPSSASQENSKEASLAPDP